MINIKQITALLLALCALCWGAAFAEGVVSTNVIMRVSKLTQDAIINEGEDLSMEVNLDGVTPTSYQWYFNDAPIDGAVQKVYNVVNATERDAGTYRMDAFSDDGNMVMSMDLAVRVISSTVPQSGDSSLPIGAVIAAMGIAAVLLTILIRRSAR